MAGRPVNENFRSSALTQSNGVLTSGGGTAEVSPPAERLGRCQSSTPALHPIVCMSPLACWPSVSTSRWRLPAADGRHRLRPCDRPDAVCSLPSACHGDGPRDHDQAFPLHRPAVEHHHHHRPHHHHVPPPCTGSEVSSARERGRGEPRFLWRPTTHKRSPF